MTEGIQVVLSIILRMSFMSSLAILAVLLLRQLLRRAPRKYSYLLWLIVLFRLLCPVDIPSPFGIPDFTAGERSESPTDNGGTPASDQTAMIPMDSGIREAQEVQNSFPAQAAPGAAASPVPEYLPSNRQDTGTAGKANAGSLPDSVLGYRTPYGMLIFAERQALMQPSGEASASYGLWIAAAGIWLTGFLACVGRGALQYIRLHRKIRFAIRNRDGVLESEAIDSPIVLGLIRPRIYIPVHLEDKQEARWYELVLLHERIHIRRGDHIWKLLLFLACGIHWFNPLVWVASILMTKDMEMSCDESVIYNIDKDVRIEYSSCLLDFSAKRSKIMTPLAFGESNTQSRIVHILKYRKPAAWISAAAVLCVLAAVVCLGTGRQGGSDTGVPAPEDEKEQGNTEPDRESGNGAAAQKEIDQEETDMTAPVWKPGDKIQPGIYVDEGNPGYEFRSYVEQELKALQREYRLVEYAGEDRTGDGNSVSWLMLYYVVNKDYTIDMCRVDIEGKLVNLTKGETGYENKYRMDTFALDISEGIQNAEELKRFCSLGDSYFTGIDLEYFEADWENPMKYLKEFHSFRLLSSNSQYFALNDPETAGAWLYGLKNTEVETILDNFMGTFIKYTFSDGSHVNMKMELRDVKAMDGFAASLKTEADNKDKKDTEEYKPYYLLQNDMSTDLWSSAWYAAKLIGEEEMENILARSGYIDGLSLSELRDMPLYEGWSENGKEPFQLYLVTEEEKYDAAVYGSEDNQMMILRVGSKWKAWHRPWTGMYDEAVRMKCGDYDRDGELEMALSIHTGTGTGFSVDEMLMADMDSTGEYILYGYETWSYRMETNERAVAEYSEETGAFRFLIDGKQQGMEMNLKEYLEENESSYLGFGIGDQVRFDWNEKKKYWEMTALPGLTIASWATPSFGETKLYAELLYKGNGQFALGDMSSNRLPVTGKKPWRPSGKDIFAAKAFTEVSIGELYAILGEPLNKVKTKSGCSYEYKGITFFTTGNKPGKEEESHIYSIMLTDNTYIANIKANLGVSIGMNEEDLSSDVSDSIAAIYQNYGEKYTVAYEMPVTTLHLLEETGVRMNGYDRAAAGYDAGLALFGAASAKEGVTGNGKGEIAAILLVRDGRIEAVILE